MVASLPPGRASRARFLLAPLFALGLVTACGAVANVDEEPRAENVDEAAAAATLPGTAPCGCQAPYRAPATAGTTQWVSARDLIPAWGFYAASDHVFATVPGHKLTWVLRLPEGSPRRYRVFARHPGSSAKWPTVTLDDAAALPAGPPVAGWTELGAFDAVSGGIHHLDLTSAPDGRTTVEAVLITSEESPIFPDTDGPNRIKAPVTTYPREYRRASGAAPWVLGPANRFEEDVTDWVPYGPKPSLEIAVARNEIAGAAFSLAVARGSTLEEVVTITASDLVGTPPVPRTKPPRIPAANVDVRVALSRVSNAALWEQTRGGPVARLLVKDDASCRREPPEALASNQCLLTGAPRLVGPQGTEARGPRASTRVLPGDERQIWVTADLAGLAGTQKLPAGEYHGTITLLGSVSGLRRELAVRLRVRELVLPDTPGWNGVFYSGTPAAHDVVVADYADQRAHGMTAIMSPNSLAGVAAATEAGFTNGKVLFTADDGFTPVAPGWDAVRFVCDEPAPPCCPHCTQPTLDGGAPNPSYHAACAANCYSDAGPSVVGCPLVPRSGCAARLPDDGTATVNRHDVLTSLQATATADGARGVRDAITVNDFNAVYWLGPSLHMPIIAVTTTNLFAPAGLPRIADEAHRPVAYWQANQTQPLYHRALAGHFSRAHGFSGVMLNTYDGQGYDHAFVGRDEVGRPIPTRTWEALRDGLTDLRYAAALDEAIAAAGARLAPPGPAPTPAELALIAEASALRNSTTDGLGAVPGYHWHLLSLSTRAWPQQADELRRRLAAMVVDLRTVRP